MRRQPASLLLLHVLALAASAAARDAAGRPALPRLRVRRVDSAASPSTRRSYILADEHGREVTLRGVDMEIEARAPKPHRPPNSPALYAHGSCPPNFLFYSQPPLCQVDAVKGKYMADLAGPNDMAQVRALGFNLVRLCLSWDGLEPTPGNYSEQYLERVAQLVCWAKEQELYVVLDMHQDLYSLYVKPSHGLLGFPPFLTLAVGQDGAPAWAVASGGLPSLAVLGIDQVNPAMLSAFQAFWSNRVLPGVPQGSAAGPGLQDHFIGALALLATRFANDSTVAGLELLNEPQPGWKESLSPYAASDTLYRFYTRAVQALTGVRDGLPTCAAGHVHDGGTISCAYPDLRTGWRGLVIAEPLAIRNMVDRSLMTPRVWTTYRNVVHAPHVYTHSFTLDSSAPTFAALLLPSPWPPSFRFAYDTAWQEAGAMHSAVLVTEFGAAASMDDLLVSPTLDAQDETGTPAALWSWMENCKGLGCWSAAWTMYAPAQGPPGAPLGYKGALYPSRRRLMSRVHSRGCVGEVLGYGYNTSVRTFFLLANATAGVVGAAQHRSRQAAGSWPRDIAALRLPSDGMGCPDGWGPCSTGEAPPSPASCASCWSRERVLTQGLDAVQRQLFPYLAPLGNATRNIHS